MINVNMEYSSGVILDSAGKYCPENINVMPTFDHINNARMWKVTVASDFRAADNMQFTLCQDDWLLEHRENETLTVVVVPHGDEPEDSNYWFYSIVQSNKPIKANMPMHCAIIHHGKVNSMTNNIIGHSLAPYTLYSDEAFASYYPYVLRIDENGGLSTYIPQNWYMHTGDYTVIALVEDSE